MIIAIYKKNLINQISVLHDPIRCACLERIGLPDPVYYEYINQDYENDYGADYAYTDHAGHKDKGTTFKSIISTCLLKYL